MILGIFLRNIKTYSGINYIPLSNGEKFSALVGTNGTGKSSVLEAMDSFFNDKPWNFHISTKKHGLITTEPHIVPFFIMRKDSIPFGNTEFLERFSECILNSSPKDANSNSRKEFTEFKKTISDAGRIYSREDYYYIVLGNNKDKKPNLSIFQNEGFLKKICPENKDLGELEKLLGGLIETIKKHIEYLYIPKEIEAEDFTKLESREIHILMGETLVDSLNKQISQNTIDNINSQLNQITSKISKELIDYEYRTVGVRQSKIRRSDINSLIIESYFKIRRLHKKFQGEWLDIKNLSSGEKQTAIIDIATKLITQHRKSKKEIIIAIDEPESSLHISKCFDQFEKVYNLSRHCLQAIVATHWYGFITSTENGFVIGINKSTERTFDKLNISSIREDIKSQKKSSNGSLPFDIKLKSTNDFVQSIISNMTSETPYNWILCEGSSEKIYFEHYLKDLKEKTPTRIIPVGGITEIKKIYNLIMATYDDFKKDFKGKIFMLCDTDTQATEWETQSSLHVSCKRIIRENENINLVSITDSRKSPKTEIEDCLDSDIFFRTLIQFSEQHEEITFIKNYSTYKSKTISSLVCDFRQSEINHLETFFSKEGIKYNFAKEYVKIAKSENSNTLPWMQEVINFFSKN